MDDQNIDSALVLAKTQKIQDYHVFAYRLNKDRDSEDYGTIIILGSFDDKDEAIEYANDLIDISGYPEIFWTRSHSWFTLRNKEHKNNKEILFIDDKNGLDDATRFITNNFLNDQRPNNEINEEEAKKLHRARCNPDHVEHYIDHLEKLVRLDNLIIQYERQINEIKQESKETIKTLKDHYLAHPKHEGEALTLLEQRRTQTDYSILSFTYDRMKSQISGNRIYSKKTAENNSEYNSQLSGQSQHSKRSRKSEQSPRSQRSQRSQRSPRKNRDNKSVSEADQDNDWRQTRKRGKRGRRR